MANSLDLFSERIGLLGAAAFIVTWITVAAHGLSGSESLPWKRASFKWGACLFILLTTASLISGNILKSRARREILLLTRSPKLQKIVLYNSDCRIIATNYLSASLSKLDYDSPSGSRFLGKKYSIAIINNDTVARLRLVQNNYDTTIYQVFYLKYITTTSNNIGLMKIESSVTQKCQ
ncbi:hypothetical protein HHL22_06675 [Hymenobacter sp. RP-2-7]|uniref:Transmembrane protein n=1 Tax=Hymenobacter polaris TaxID=2682546 RepID=A0A7Y0FLK0_9BACT|nr:hypothetical protein [Hymenobacter polaris]NML64887.1 hypothetical protein [Hymenobacter polaris]